MEPTVQTAIEVALSAAGALDVSVAPLVPSVGITVNADGSISGVREAVEAFKTSKPHFFKPSVAGMSPQDYRAHRQTAVNGLRERNQVEVPQPAKPVAEMDRKEYNRHRQAVTKALGRRGRR
jgi:hypothetical protein